MGYFESLEPRYVLDSTVVFNEVMYNPAGTDEGLEFIELHNQMAVDVDVSSWRLTDGVDFTFAEGTIVPGRGYIVIAKNPATLLAATGVTSFGPFGGQLSNDGEQVTLLDRSGRVMDALEYSDVGDWPAAPDGTGASLAKKYADGASGKTQNWASSVRIGGTPGAANFSAPISTAALEINEIAAATTSPFWFELVNYGTTSLNLSGYTIASTGGGQHTLGNTPLAAGQYLVVNEAQLGFRPLVGDEIYVISPDGTLVVVAATVADRLQGRSIKGTGPFQFPNVATPGSDNSFSFHDEIVINEIMYHHLPNPSSPGTPAIPPVPPTYSTTELIGLNKTWRYNATGDALPVGWQSVAHPVGGNWSQGPGLIGYETGVVPAPGLGTTLPNPLTPTPRGFVTTYYFETEFTLTAQQLASLDHLQLRHVIDDGAVFYINGVEVGPRFNMPTGDITSQTFATDGPPDASLSNVITISANNLVVGTNRFSAEVHQVSTASGDVMFGVQLSAAIQTSPGSPGVPATPAIPVTENPEEWIELYNRGAATINLSGWTFDDAIGYTFPNGTTIAPGEYLVIANDAASLAAKYPSIRILGNFSGKLSNSDDRVVLKDSAGNTADEVHYYEDGRWAGAADGDGSSLELRNPNADNSVGEAWSASDESDKSAWRTYTYRGVAQTSAVGPDGAWQEFVLGLLDSGEVLLDDVSVIESPGTSSVFQLISNSTFQADAIGGSAAGWRFIGNHRHSEVIADPDAPGNRVLRLVATGATEHMHNHGETTLAAGRTIQNGKEYEISFRAKWISGTSALNTRLYFNRLAKTTRIDQSGVNGTPGAINSVYEANVGPTYREFIHGPAVPTPGVPVTVTTFADDPNGVASMVLWYAVNGGAWQSVAMTSGPNGRYSGTIPGQAAQTIVQFYVEGTDGLGAKSTFPRDGRDSRALFKVDGGEASNTGINNLRIILTPSDAAYLHSTINLMSNDVLGATIVYNEREIFYDAGVRLSGSERARPEQVRVGFAVRFNAEQLFRGVHSGLTLDRSDGVGFGQRELLLNTAAGHAGGIPAEYNDLVNIITPQAAHTGGALMQLARFGDVFLDSQFSNGSDGALYEYELVYYPLQADGRGNKLPAPDGVVGTGIQDLGDDKENYRWTFLNKNNRSEDDYARIMEWAKIMGLSGAAFNTQIASVMDVDQYLRAMAFSSVTGFGDNYAAGSAHNAQFYVRPEDNRVLYFPHDLDAFFNASMPVVSSGDLQKILNADPTYRHNYYGYVHDIVANTLNRTYMQHWADNFRTLLPNQNWTSWLADIGARATNVFAQVNNAIPSIPFSITTNGGANFTVNASTATLAGNGWVNVHKIFIAGQDRPLDIRWTDSDSWTATVPLKFGANPITLQAVDYRGGVVATDAVTITSTFVDRSLQDYLRITELNYHPADHAGVADPEDLEFIELTNVGTTPLDLSGVKLTDFVTTPYVFPSGVTLAGGERIVVARNPAVLQSVYGTGFRVASVGYGSANLANSGEGVSLLTATNDVIVSFAYDDAAPWPTSPDGDGYTLEIINPLGDAGSPANWRASSVLGGTPGMPSPSTTSADFNSDGAVDGADFLAWQRGFGIAAGAQRSQGDADGNGSVNADDLAIWRQGYGMSGSESSATASQLLRSTSVTAAAVTTPQITEDESPSSLRPMAIDERSVVAGDAVSPQAVGISGLPSHWSGLTITPHAVPAPFSRFRTIEAAFSQLGSNSRFVYADDEMREGAEALFRRLGERSKLSPLTSFEQDQIDWAALEGDDEAESLFRLARGRRRS